MKKARKKVQLLLREILGILTILLKKIPATGLEEKKKKNKSAKQRESKKKEEEEEEKEEVVTIGGGGEQGRKKKASSSLDVLTPEESILSQDPYLHVILVCGIIRGALANMGHACTVTAEIPRLPRCSFQVRIPSSTTTTTATTTT